MQRSRAWLWLACWACNGGHAVQPEAGATLASDGGADARGAHELARDCSLCVDDLGLGEDCQLLDLYTEEVTEHEQRNLFVSGQTLFYAAGASVRSYDLENQTASKLASLQTYGGITADEGSVYVGESGSDSCKLALTPSLLA